jgi:phage terminase small subunit
MPVLRNPRHEKFSQLVASSIKPKEAYISVGYKPTGAKQAGSRLLMNIDVRERVSELQEAAARSTADALILNRERVLHRLSQLSHEAQQKGSTRLRRAARN